MFIRSTYDIYHKLSRLRCALPCRRSFFTLPDLSSLSPFSGHEPQTYHERKILPYQSRQLYNIVADVESYPRFIPFCTGTRIIDTKRRGDSPASRICMDAEMTVGFLSLKESYISKVTCTPYLSVEAVASSSSPLFKTLSTTWRFQPASPSSPHSSAGQLPRPKSSHAYQESPIFLNDHAGPTLVTLDLAFAFSNPVHATISATFFGQVSKLMVKAFEERCLEVYGPGNK